jgi:hypothetical protein
MTIKFRTFNVVRGTHNLRVKVWLKQLRSEAM